MESWESGSSLDGLVWFGQNTSPLIVEYWRPFVIIYFLTPNLSLTCSIQANLRGFPMKNNMGVDLEGQSVNGVYIDIHAVFSSPFLLNQLHSDVRCVFVWGLSNTVRFEQSGLSPDISGLPVLSFPSCSAKHYGLCLSVCLSFCNRDVTEIWAKASLKSHVTRPMQRR